MSRTKARPRKDTVTLYLTMNPDMEYPNSVAAFEAMKALGERKLMEYAHIETERLTFDKYGRLQVREGVEIIKADELGRLWLEDHNIDTEYWGCLGIDSEHPQSGSDRKVLAVIFVERESTP